MCIRDRRQMCIRDSHAAGHATAHVSGPAMSRHRLCFRPSSLRRRACCLAPAGSECWVKAAATTGEQDAKGGLE
eukprot:1597652-Rhodomonas_salina.1